MKQNTIKRANIVVEGLVQGVSFRAYTRRKAQSIGVVGYVRNLPDGNVEVDIEGTELQIYQLIKWLRKEGSPASVVSDIKVEWINELKNYKNFRIAF